MLGQGEKYTKDNPDSSKFAELFSNSFDPIYLDERAKTEIAKIDSILN
jgi:hypothetical protein